MRQKFDHALRLMVYLTETLARLLQKNYTLQYNHILYHLMYYLTAGDNRLFNIDVII